MKVQWIENICGEIRGFSLTCAEGGEDGMLEAFFVISLTGSV